jgi:hypothetical protein
MGPGLGTVFHFVESKLGGTVDDFTFTAQTMRRVVQEVRGMQAERAALEMELNRREFEIKILQMTQGALKMEIDRLRAATAPVTVYATDAVVTFGPSGVMLQAPLVEMTGDVTVTA